MPDFPIWPQCNIGCVFCSNPVDGYRETTDKYSYDELRRKLLDYKRGLRTFVKFDEVRDYFNLTGGEPTLHPEFLKVLALIRTEFPSNLIRLLTNGRMLADEGFARRTCGIAGLPFEIAVPMFGGTPAAHEATSRSPGSFEQTTRGLRHLRRHRRDGQKVEIRIIMTRVQEKFLDGLIDHLLAEFSWVDRVVFLFEELEGFAEKYRDRLVFTQSEAARAIDRNFDKLAGFKDVRLYHFALCAVPTRLWPRVWRTLADFKVTWLDGCRTSCLYRAQCVGVHRSYLRHAGAPDIAPIAAPRPVELSGDPYRPILSADAETSARR
ncbi:MAG: radical SAM protein [Elusimicrobia bacterium]|nr:radical SAM protein [Elusimicrobiota bacterium]